MARRSSRKSSHKPRRPIHREVAPSPTTGETPTADAATVAWMLAMLATLSAEIVGTILRTAVVYGRSPSWLEVPARTLLVVAMLLGLLTITLTPVVLRVRNAPPPRPLVIGAYVIGVVPLLALVLTR